MSKNQLGRETSPYLLQHKDNPVHWRAWNAAALAEAAAQDRPILLSVGYAACHWCHVMAHESFENPEIARLINELFVAIKVDREERPDLDQIYQQALALLGQHGGWPLTMFLTPAGEPFWGGTYFPPEKRWGRPGFPAVLRGIAEAWRDDRNKVAGNVAAMMQGLTRLSQPKGGGLVETAQLDVAIRRVLEFIDPKEGGLGNTPKFPNCPLLELLWRGYVRTGDAAMRNAVLLTLDRMCQGGIYDHLGGGFARYSTDAEWLVPHFEKMLYDNAQLIHILTWVWQETKSPLYAARIEETARWVMDEMIAPEGGFAAAVDADSEHQEGRYYVWTEAAVDEALGAESALFKSFYDVTPQGNWEGHTILNRRAKPLFADDATEATLARCRDLLLAVRRRRTPPLRDDKVLADWNGLMIAALAQAATVFGRKDWLAKAVDAWNFVTTRMMSENRLCHSWRKTRTHPGTLDDHADMANAALSLHEATGEARYLEQAVAWTNVMDRHYAAPEGGYYLAADDTETLIRRTRTVTDSAAPSGNGAALTALARLAALTGDLYYRDQADALIRAFSGELEGDLFLIAAYLNGIDLWAGPLQIAIIGDREAADTAALLAAVHGAALPNRVLSVVPSDQSLPRAHPAFGKKQVKKKATAYVCRGPVCSLPMIKEEELAEALRER